MKIDKTIAAVVTGGASGLGRASAEALAAAGVKVAIFDVNEAGGQEVAKALGGVFCKVDITSEDSVVEGYAKARAAHGQERIVVHCAVVSGGGKTISFDKETGSYKRNPTEMIARAADGSPQFELFDYAHDPRETRNVAAAHPAVIRDLLAQLARLPEIPTPATKASKKSKTSAAPSPL